MHSGGGVFPFAASFGTGSTPRLALDAAWSGLFLEQKRLGWENSKAQVESAKIVDSCGFISLPQMQRSN